MGFNNNLLDKKSNIDAFYGYFKKSPKKAVKNFLDEGYIKLNPNILSVMGSRKALTNNEIEGIIKVKVSQDQQLQRQQQMQLFKRILDC